LPGRPSKGYYFNVKTAIRNISKRLIASNIWIILLILLLITAGQTMAEIGAGKPDGIIPGLNMFLIISYIIFLTRGVLWSIVLKNHPVNQVYPYLSLSYPLVLIVSILFFNESISAGKIAGTLLIILGTTLMIPGNPAPGDAS